MKNNTCDFLVIGSGIAGLSFALHAASAGKVIIVTKKRDSESNTNYAQGGIACVLDPEDCFQNHIKDTLETGARLCNEKAVRILVEEGPQRVKELLDWGVRFTRSRHSRAFGKMELGREGGHSKDRIVHARDLTGKELEKKLIDRIRSHPRISLYENHHTVDIITDHHFGNRNTDTVSCYGAYVLDTVKRNIFPIYARVTFLATGGAGQVYLHTTNPGIATGDGIAAAYRAGAVISNMEFIQFHPTTLYHPDADSFLISEALRGYGAILKNHAGETFMDRYHPMKSLAPRDIVARAIDNEMKHSGEPCVFLDIRNASPAATRRKFPNIYSRCRKYGIDITKDLIPVVPAAHYICGGIKVDTNGKTTIRNLYACGETACTGVHGANRLASNSLLEAVVFSKRAADHAGSILCSVKAISPQTVPAWNDKGTMDTEEWVLLSHNRQELRSVMWDYVGIVRSDIRLQRAMRRIKLLEKETENYYKRTRITPELLELRNLITTAKLIIQSAGKRRESRGLHYTTDYPERNDKRWKHDTIIRNTARI